MTTGIFVVWGLAGRKMLVYKTTPSRTVTVTSFRLTNLFRMDAFPRSAYGLVSTAAFHAAADQICTLDAQIRLVSFDTLRPTFWAVEGRDMRIANCEPFGVHEWSSI